MYDFHRELRWLHNRALHNWGIAVGFAVSGAKGSREVTVSPGYALDCQDTICCSRARHACRACRFGQCRAASRCSTTSPPRTPTTRASRRANRVMASATGGGAVRRIEAPLVRWQDPRSVVTENRWRRGIDIVLAAVQVLDCALVAAPSTAERRGARPEPQPFVAAGTSAPESTVWTFFTGRRASPASRPPSTPRAPDSSARPTYTAQIVGTRVLKADTGSGSPNGMLVDGFGSVVSPTSNGSSIGSSCRATSRPGPYTLNPDAIFVAKTLDTLRTALRWSVAWMGVEG